MTEKTFEVCAAELVAAVHDVVGRCLRPVPSAPLIKLGRAMEQLECVEPAADDHPIWGLLEAALEVDWQFWPEGEYGSDQADVTLGAVMDLQAALLDYQRAVPYE